MLLAWGLPAPATCSAPAGQCICVWLREEKTPAFPADNFIIKVEGLEVVETHMVSGGFHEFQPVHFVPASPSSYPSSHLHCFKGALMALAPERSSSLT